MTAAIPKHKRDLLRKDYLGERLPLVEIAQKLNIAPSTVFCYRKAFQFIERDHPDRIQDLDFNLSNASVGRDMPELSNHTRLMEVLPDLIDKQTDRRGINLRSVYAQYRALCPKGYKFQDFYTKLSSWREENHICYYHHLRIRTIPPGDLKILNYWRRYATETLKWKRAVVILGSFSGRHVRELMAQVEVSIDTICKWLDDYRTGGIEALERKPCPPNEAVLKRVQTKQENIVKLLHQSPKLHGINRSSWRLKDLAEIYERTYKEYISTGCVRKNLTRANYYFKKSKEVLTSPDPKFREKLDHIQHILRNLRPDESFFSVDEYGHFSVRLKGGRTFVKPDKLVSVPQLQKSKGFMVVTAALELATNQVTHFYSRKKDTEEMIKMVDILLIQYRQQSKLFISWDAASWHRSLVLKRYLEDINSDAYRAANHTPLVEMAPLPCSAQFLNVIESVFSGLARAVIHNSDYSCLEECQEAIDRHFRDRNEHFLKNPKQAGNKIWGKEIVKPVFSDANHCQVKK